MTMNPEQAAFFADTFARLTDNVGQALLGKAPGDPPGADLHAGGGASIA